MIYSSHFFIGGVYGGCLWLVTEAPLHANGSWC